jgi:phytoene/squalene synthetase
LRDVGDHARNGRGYLPAEDLEQLSIAREEVLACTLGDIDRCRAPMPFAIARLHIVTECVIDQRHLRDSLTNISAAPLSAEPILVYSAWFRLRNASENIARTAETVFHYPSRVLPVFLAPVFLSSY